MTRSRLLSVRVVLCVLLAGNAVLVAGSAERPSGQAQNAPSSQQSPSDPRTIFRSGVTYVEIPTVVVDRKGQFVSGLSRDDFEVIEEGETQAIETFRLIDFGPVAPRDPASSQPDADVASNEVPFDGRVYVLAGC